MAKLFLDLGSTTGFHILTENEHETSIINSIFDNQTLEKATISHKDNPFALTEFLTSFVEEDGFGGFVNPLTEIVVEWGCGFMSRQSWRNFGIYQYVVEYFCYSNNIKLTKIKVQSKEWKDWLKNRTTKKTDANDAYELFNFYTQKEVE